MQFFELPPELIIVILSYLPMFDIVPAAYAHKYLFELAGNLAFPYCFNELFENLDTAVKGLPKSLYRGVFYIGGAHWIKCQLGKNKAADDLFIGAAGGFGYLRYVQACCKVPQFNFAAHRNLAIKIASRNGHDQVVRQLLTCDDINPGHESDLAVDVACQNNHVETVKLLLTHSDVDPTTDDDFALCVAVQNDLPDVVNIVVRCPKVSCAADSNFSIKECIKNANPTIFRILLTGDGVDINSYYVNPFFSLCRNQCTEMLKMALATVDSLDPLLLTELWQVASELKGIEVMHVLVTCLTPEYFHSDECWNLILLTNDYDFVRAMLKRRRDSNFQLSIDLMKTILTKVRNPLIIRLFMSFDDLPFHLLEENLFSTVVSGVAGSTKAVLELFFAHDGGFTPTVEQFASLILTQEKLSTSTLRNVARAVEEKFVPNKFVMSSLAEYKTSTSPIICSRLRWLLTLDDIKPDSLLALYQKLDEMMAPSEKEPLESRQLQKLEDILELVFACDLPLQGRERKTPRVQPRGAKKLAENG